MSMCRIISYVVRRVCLLTSAFSWQNSVNFCPASFCTPRPNLPVTPGISWVPTFAFQSSMMKRTSFWVLVLEGLVGHHRTIQLQLLQHYWLEHRLRLLWYWMVCLGNRDHSVVFETASKYCIWDSFVYYEAYFISSKGFLPTVVDIMVINSPISVHFSSLIPKTSMFTLTISCLTTSSLPWFMDLTFQLPMQYCSLQHQTLLYHQSHPWVGVVFALAPSLHSFWSYFSTGLQ